jgi:hypothetical protein
MPAKTRKSSKTGGPYRFLLRANFCKACNRPMNLQSVGNAPLYRMELTLCWGADEQPLPRDTGATAITSRNVCSSG